MYLVILLFQNELYNGVSENAHSVRAITQWKEGNAEIDLDLYPIYSFYK